MTEIKFKVSSVEVLQTDGADEIFLHLADFKPSFPSLNLPATAQINTQKNHGIQWCKENLGVEPKVVSVRTNS